MKLGLAALVLLGASIAAAFLAVVVGAAVSGPTVASGERAVTAIAAVDLAVAVAAIVLFWRRSAVLVGVARTLAVVAFAAVEFAVLAVLLVLSVIVFNR